MSETAKISGHIFGDKLYQARAREAFPILVRQAEAEEPIFYSDLAEELRMPNARNLNYPLGSIGKTLQHLSRKWSEEIPPLQSLVVTRSTGLPGEGFDGFVLERLSKVGKFQRSKIVRSEQAKVYAYPHWRKVLAELGLPYVSTKETLELLKRATEFRAGGESGAHRDLKNYIAKNPYCLGLNHLSGAGITERSLASGDKLDVSFEHDDEWIAVEVKSAVSNIADITRGLFQCRKYRATMEAMDAVELRRRNVRAILALETTFPPTLVHIKNTLGVEVVSNIRR